MSPASVGYQESSNRAKMPVWQPDTRLMRKGATGVAWNPIIEWPIEVVFQRIAQAGLKLHEAYTKYGASRVSCAFCIMSAGADLQAAASCPDNHDVYRRMVALEAASTFGFQSGKWLADVAPHLLGPALAAQIAIAKAQAKAREQAEAEIPKHLLYSKGWPSAMPTAAEAELIASVRRRVSDAVSLKVQCLSAPAVLGRYEQLLLLKPATTEAPVECQIQEEQLA